MLTSYEHYVLTEMLGAPDSPPRHNGHLCFGQAWEQSHRLDDPSWDYYECWLAALEKAVLVAGLITAAELAGLCDAAERPGHGGSKDDGAP
jgi:hypothetical protein